jgi:hypothetical protein
MTSGVLWIGSGEQDQRRQNYVLQQLMEGRSNATGTATLSSTGATSTTVTAPTCGANSSVFLFPQTSIAQSSAAAFVPSTDVVAGSFIVHHSSSTSTSRLFFWAAIG